MKRLKKGFVLFYVNYDKLYPIQMTQEVSDELGELLGKAVDDNKLVVQSQLVFEKEDDDAGTDKNNP